MERRIRVGSIGWGAASSLWRDLVGGPLVAVAVCEADPALAEGIRDRYRLENAYTDVRAMLSKLPRFSGNSRGANEKRVNFAAG